MKCGSSTADVSPVIERTFPEPASLFLILASWFIDTWIGPVYRPQPILMGVVRTINRTEVWTVRPIQLRPGPKYPPLSLAGVISVRRRGNLWQDCRREAKPR